MAKKLSLLLAAVAVLAFAIPAMANADELTVEELPGSGTFITAPVGTVIRATGSDVTLKSTLLSNITCATLNLNGEVTKNNGTVVEGNGNNVSPTQAGCKNGEKTVTVTSVNVTNIKAEKPGEATASFVAKVDVGTLECKFTGTNVKGTFTTGTGVLKFNAASGVVGEPTSCGNATLTGEFTFERASDNSPMRFDS